MVVYQIIGYTDMKGLFYYPDNKHRYVVLFEVKAKDPTTGKWNKSVLYKGIEDGKFYVRELKDFLHKFVKLGDGNNGI